MPLRRKPSLFIASNPSCPASNVRNYELTGNEACSVSRFRSCRLQRLFKAKLSRECCHYLIRCDLLRRDVCGCSHIPPRANSRVEYRSDGIDSIFVRQPFLFPGKTSTVQIPMVGRFYSSVHALSSNTPSRSSVRLMRNH